MSAASRWSPRQQHQRLLFDADIDLGATGLAEAVGFDVVHAVERDDLRTASDDSLIRWANDRQRILITHDRHRPTDPSSSRVAWEIAIRGGRVINLGPSTMGDPAKIVGTLLVTYSEWAEFFDREIHGRVRVHPGETASTQTQDQLLQQRAALILTEPGDFPSRLRSREPGRSRRREETPDPRQLEFPDLRESDSRDVGPETAGLDQ